MSFKCLFCFEFCDYVLEVVAGSAESDLRGTLSCTEDNESRTLPESTMVGGVKLLAVDISIGYSHDTGIAIWMASIQVQ